MVIALPCGYRFQLNIYTSRYISPPPPIRQFLPSIVPSSLISPLIYPFIVGEMITALPCGHRFHRGEVIKKKDKENTRNPNICNPNIENSNVLNPNIRNPEISDSDIRLFGIAGSTLTSFSIPSYTTATTTYPTTTSISTSNSTSFATSTTSFAPTTTSYSPTRFLPDLNAYEDNEDSKLSCSQTSRYISMIMYIFSV
jgi:hypothetical protein